MKTKPRNCTHPTCPPAGPCRRPPTPKKARNRIPRVSKKRARENRTYSTERKKFLTDTPNCQAKLDGCTFQATDVHHPQGRIGARFLDKSKWIAVCRSCHKQIEERPAMARERNLSQSRLTKINNTL